MERILFIFVLTRNSEGQKTMEKIRKLYPMTFHPIEDRNSWGTVKTVLADIGFEDSVIKEGWLAENSMGDIMETYMERVVGESVYGYYGRQFPILARFIETSGDMPVHVHADDTVAGQRYDALGGKELWYVTEAGNDATIWLGFDTEVSATEVYERCSAGTIKEVLRKMRLEKGDCIVVEPGTVHAASGHFKAAIVKESSDLPFILSGNDAGGMEGNHLAEAMDFINYGPGQDQGKVAEQNGVLSSCPEFHVARIMLKDPVRISSEEFGGFIIYIGIEGAATVQVQAEEDGRKKTDSYTVRKGEAILIPAEIQDYILMPTDRNTVLLEAGPGKREETDDYINPDTEPFLKGEDYEGLEYEDDENNDKPGPNDSGNARGCHNMNWN